MLDRFSSRATPFVALAAELAIDEATAQEAAAHEGIRFAVIVEFAIRAADLENAAV